ncbi:hypothetical protein JOE61_003070 [Nocardioides salarius]|uniref:DUF3017 domain-containing protein n=1 Tax=Nocardioides salarius TaxID=374513 RepID=A0ABS2MDJ1_9ACTN|nr:DUF3017 domain-containing protein [Nocardioides salarius]MBM7509256.1 hypothetical protein [Nocardioides salarius]
MNDPAAGAEPPEPPVDPDEEHVPSVDEIADEIAEEEGRRYPSTLGGLLYLGVLAAGAVGIALAVLGDWRVGVSVLAGAMVAAATMRLVLPARDAGMLAVRHRLVDVLLLGGVGGILLFLARTIPNQPGL